MVIKICTQPAARAERGLGFREHLFTSFGFQARDCRPCSLYFLSLKTQKMDETPKSISKCPDSLFMGPQREKTLGKGTQNGMLGSVFQLLCATGNCKVKRTALVSIINASLRAPVKLQLLSNTREERQSLEGTSSPSHSAFPGTRPRISVFFCFSTPRFAALPQSPWKCVHMARYLRSQRSDKVISSL